MINGRKIITLCGSTRFKNEFERLNKELTLRGNVVISVAFYPQAGDTVSEAEKSLLDDIHLCKVELADSIFVINKDGYVGQSTSREIEHAKTLGKGVSYLEPEHVSP